MIWTLRAFGDPSPKGSWEIYALHAPLRYDGDCFYRIKDMALKPSQGDRLRRWKHALEIAVLEAGRPKHPIAGCPVTVTCMFLMHRPAKPKDAQPIVAPDLDKLVRAVGDVLQGVYYANDSQIVAWKASKMYELDGNPGAIVAVEIDEKKQLDFRE